MRASPEILNREGFRTDPADREECVDAGQEEALLEVAPISEQFLTEFYASPAFWSTVRRTWDAVERFGGRELGFTIWKEAGSSFTWMTEPCGGEYPDETDLSASVDEMRAADLGTMFRLGSLHFHPDLGLDPVIVPSGSKLDLGVFAHDRDWNRGETGYDIPAIECIAARTTKSTIKALVLQEPLSHTPLKLPAIRRELDLTLGELRRQGTQDDVLAALRHYGYRAHVLTPSPDGFRAEDLQTLAAFSFTPRPCREGQ